MKSYLLVVLLIILFLNSLFAEIRNGYESKIVGFRISLLRLEKILAEDNLSATQRRKIKQKIKSLVDFMVYHEVTHVLLKQFKAIAPELYNEIDTLKDASGRSVDVYVKLISKSEAELQSMGMATFQQAANDSRLSASEYGEGSVSINIWIWHRALHVLSHEFGHIKYVVPNLASYVKFYRRHYPNMTRDTSLGHTSSDPSGKSAYEFEERFEKKYFLYLKGDSPRVASPMVLINPIRKNLLLQMEQAYLADLHQRNVGHFLVYPTFSFLPDSMER